MKSPAKVLTLFQPHWGKAGVVGFLDIGFFIAEAHSFNVSVSDYQR